MVKLIMLLSAVYHFKVYDDHNHFDASSDKNNLITTPSIELPR